MVNFQRWRIAPISPPRLAKPAGPLAERTGRRGHRDVIVTCWTHTFGST